MKPWATSHQQHDKGNISNIRPITPLNKSTANITNNANNSFFTTKVESPIFAGKSLQQMQMNQGGGKGCLNQQPFKPIANDFMSADDSTDNDHQSIGLNMSHSTVPSTPNIYEEKASLQELPSYVKLVIDRSNKQHLNMMNIEEAHHLLEEKKFDDVFTLVMEDTTKILQDSFQVLAEKLDHLTGLSEEIKFFKEKVVSDINKTKKRKRDVIDSIETLRLVLTNNSIEVE
jgi:hypothetical protein